jgi:hypothetical protein
MGRRYLKFEQAGRIDAFLRRAKRYGFADCNYDFCGMLELADVKIFKNILMEHHCLHHILPPVKPGGSYLRMRGHNFILPYEQHGKSYIPWCLYKSRLRCPCNSLASCLLFSTVSSTITFVYRNKSFAYLLPRSSRYTFIAAMLIVSRLRSLRLRSVRADYFCDICDDNTQKLGV